jgi:tetratricopeptide (TPR) repeat protein
MKKSLLTLAMVLALTGLVTSQATAPPQTAPATGQPQTAPSQTGPAPAPAQQKKEIKDPNEYNSYVSAVRQTDPAAKAQGLESFLQQYPNSVVKEDALEALMGAYQQAGNMPKLAETANRLLQVSPNNVPALALLAVSRRAAAEQGQNPQANFAEARQLAERGLAALPRYAKPEGMSDQQFQQQKMQLAGVLNNTAGFAALQMKDYPAAQRYLRAAVEANPQGAQVQDVYPLAVAYLEAQPMDQQGLFFVARAAALSVNNPQQQQQILRYGRSRYVKYHGSEEGWEQLLAQARTTPLPPPGFMIKPAPSPAEQAAELVRTKAVKDMSFDEMQLIFTSGNQVAADTVWGQIKEKPIAFEAKVLGATRTKLTLAATFEDIQRNIADLEVTMANPIPAARVPKVGSTVKLQAVPVSYTANPFMINMIKGDFLGGPPKAAASKTPAKKAPAKRRR